MSETDVITARPMPGGSHGTSVKNPEQYEGLQEKAMSKQRGAGPPGVVPAPVAH